MSRRPRYGEDAGSGSTATPNESVFDRPVSATAFRSETVQPIALLSVLNQLDEGIILLDDRCNAFWANTVFAAAMRADPEGDRILTETRRLAGTVATIPLVGAPASSSSGVPPALPVARTDISTRVACYSLRATRLGRDAEFMERPFDVVVSMARVTRRTPDIEGLVNRFGLTQAEASVALLLARGMSNRDIAQTLAVSTHTARHHTENVLVKLHVHTRAAVGSVVLDAAWPGTPDDTSIRARRRSN